MKKIFCIVALLLSLSAYSIQPSIKRELKVNRLFSDHMVLQRQSRVNIWGQYTPGQKVTITAGWGAEVYINSDNTGNWKVKLLTPKAGGPYTIKITTTDKTIIINDVLIGEVWLASGQSNMDLPVKGWLPGDSIYNSKQEIAKANYPSIRVLKVLYNISTHTIDSIPSGVWVPATPQTVGEFSATAYFYARKLYQELNIPIGIIQSAVGGTPVEAWTSKVSLKTAGDFDKQIDGLDKLEATIRDWFVRWPSQSTPRTDNEWKQLQLNDQIASQTKYDDSNWGKTKLPGRFDRLSSGEFDGVLWLRKEFIVKDLTVDYVLKIGSVDDMDESYINGKKVGGIMESGNATTPREYVIPASLLVKGVNTIAIRAIDTGGPGLVNGPITLTNKKGETISLEGEWKSRLIAEIVTGKLYTFDLQANLSERPNITLLNSNSPTVLFNAMINPLIPYTIKGAIWYQGESNVGRAEQYKRLFPLMILDWRKQWGYEFPFYYVQIAPYLYGSSDQKNQSQKLRDAQRYALKLPKTGMAVTLDIGKLASAHPAFKQEVGNRLARFALNNEYNKKQVTSGPLYKSVSVSGDKLTIIFEPKSVGSGLLAAEKGLLGFEIAGADKIYAPAKAEIVDNKLVVFSASVSQPVYVRYAWSDGFAATLFNKEGLPASTFTSEE